MNKIDDFTCRLVNDEAKYFKSTFIVTLKFYGLYYRNSKIIIFSIFLLENKLVNQSLNFGSI